MSSKKKTQKRVRFGATLMRQISNDANRFDNFVNSYRPADVTRSRKESRHETIEVDPLAKENARINADTIKALRKNALSGSEMESAIRAYSKYKGETYRKMKKSKSKSPAMPIRPGGARKTVKKRRTKKMRSWFSSIF